MLKLEKCFSSDPVVNTMVTHVDSLQLVEVHSGRGIHTAVCGSLHARVALKESCSSGEAHAGVGY